MTQSDKFNVVVLGSGMAIVCNVCQARDGVMAAVIFDWFPEDQDMSLVELVSRGAAHWAQDHTAADPE